MRKLIKRKTTVRISSFYCFRWLMDAGERKFVYSRSVLNIRQARDRRTTNVLSMDRSVFDESLIQGVISSLTLFPIKYRTT